MLSKAQPGEYAPYAIIYLNRIPDAADVLELLTTQLTEFPRLLANVSEEQASAPRTVDGKPKWTLKQELGHLCDADRIFGYRALSIARGEQASLPSWDQDAYVASADFHQRRFRDLLDQWILLRRANLAEFSSWDPAIYDRRGTASNTSVTVRGILSTMAGHIEHHIALLRPRL